MALRRSLPAIAVLCSGQGTNLQAILEAIKAKQLRARVAIVLSDRADAYALVRAKRAGVEALFVDPKAFPDRQAFEHRLIALLEQRGVRLVCLAGFMRMLSPLFVRRFARRIVNIHPALLPAFPGVHAIQDALAWGAKLTGVTVHLVDEQMDHGPILLQESLPIRAGETAERLWRRVHQIEHRLYPQAIQLLVDGRIRLRGRVVVAARVRSAG